MTNDWPIVVQMLRHPESLGELSLGQWDLLIRQAHHAELLARVAWLAEESGLLESLPSPVWHHLESARIGAESNARQVRWEINRICHALKALHMPLILLKGAAYELARLPAACGRTYFDVDIMVPKASLSEVEKALKWQGWFASHHDEYDDRYYRKWMHELPPMRHADRRSVLDVHHTILPETARLKPNAERLFAAATTIPGHANLKVLSPEDMVLHSATHLFCDGELEHGLRDLVDLDLLFRHFGKDPEFWEKLVHRAGEQDLTRPLYYAVTYCKAILATPIPETVLQSMAAFRPFGFAIINRSFLLALMPDHPSCDSLATPLARAVLYVRSHYLRMPLRLLLPHLLHKAFKKEEVPQSEIQG